ncbi:MAG: response regulator, partial [Vicingaceae bacterium]
MKDIKALIVEDDFIIKMFLEQLITGKGCEVINTYDSGEALMSDIVNVEPSLIFMDVILSGELNGIEVASALKENNKIPIVFVTGNKDR